MKRKFKLIVPSFLTLIFCLLLIAGSTFALFTSQAEASIEVTSGKVDLDATLSNMQAYSAEAVSDEVYETLTDAEKASNAEAFGVNSKYKYTLATQSSTNEKLWTFATGGTALLSNDNLSLTLDKVVPGDKVSLRLNLINSSNVKINYRVRVVASIDTGLLSGLTINIKDGENPATQLYGAIMAGKWTKWAAPATETETKVLNLEVVLPIEKGNEYQDKNAKLRFIVEAVQGNAKTDDLLADMNAKLAAYAAGTEGKNNTFHDAIADLAKADETYGAFNEAAVTQYVWNSKYDQLVPENELEESPVRYFKAYTEMPATQTFSIYAQGNWNEQNLSALKVGFDAGDATNITDISYIRNAESDEAQEVIIRTNSVNTNLVINAPKDVVHHYDLAGTLTIYAIANSSYHEFGKIGFLEIKTGRVALETGSDVEHIHLATTDVVEDELVVDEVFDNIVISKASGVTMPNLSRDPVTIPEEGKLVVELQDSTNENEANSDFIWLTAVGIYEQVAISDNAETAKSTDNTTTYATAITGTQAEVQEKQTAAQQIANNITFTDNSVDYKVTASQVNGEWEYKVVNENTNVVALDYQAEKSATTNTVDVTINSTPVETIVENGLDATEKAEIKTDAKQKTCDHTNKTVTKTASYHSEVCDDCGKVISNQQAHNFGSGIEIDSTYQYHKFTCTVCEYEKIEMHEYPFANCSTCIHCAHTNNKIIMNYNNVDYEYTSIAKAIAAFNASEFDGKHTLTFGPGIYNIEVNELVILESKTLHSKGLTIQGTKDESNYLTIIKPSYPSHDQSKFQINSNNGIFCVSGQSSMAETGGVLVKDLEFNLTEDRRDSNHTNCRVFAIYCLNGHGANTDPQEDAVTGELFNNINGGVHRYARNITVDGCKFNGPNAPTASGKFASVIGANKGDSQPSGLTIKNCVADHLNCWFNGYVVTNYGFGLKIIDCTGTYFLVLANVQSSSTQVEITNVDGSFFAVYGERWLVKDGGTTTVNVSNCEWTLLAPAPEGDGNKDANPRGALASVGNGSVYNVSNTSLTRYSGDLEYPFARVKPGCSMTVNGKVNNKIIQVIVNNGNNGWGSDITTFQTINQ